MHPDSDNCDGEEDEKSLSGENEEKEENEVDTVMLGRCTSATECPHLTVEIEVQEMFLRLEFSQVVAQKLVETKR